MKPITRSGEYRRQRRVCFDAGYLAALEDADVDEAFSAYLLRTRIWRYADLPLAVLSAVGRGDEGASFGELLDSVFPERGRDAEAKRRALCRTIAKLVASGKLTRRGSRNHWVYSRGGSVSRW